MSTEPKKLIPLAFEVLQDRDAYVKNISEDTYPTTIIWGQLLLMGIFIFLYGLVMGSYNSFAQAISSGVKLWVLLLVTLLICFPSFYIVQLVLGSKVKLKQLLILLLSGFVMTTTIMLAFAPIILFFQLSGDNYHFLQLLHVFVFAFAGIFGMRVVLDSLKNAFEKTNVYPKVGVTVFRIWIVIFAFVGIQLSWNLRPFVGSKDMTFELFRSETRGNFYSTVLGSVGHMFGISGESKKEQKKDTPSPEPTENH